MITHFSRSVLLLLLLAIAGEAGGQVRIRKHRNKFDDKRDRMVRPADEAEEQQPKRKKHSHVTARIKAATSPDGRNSMDATFYVKWQKGKLLRYSDFTYNKNLYNKFLPVQDTDLARVIYPDYRDFYKKLNDRLNPAHLNEDSLWRARVEKVLRDKPGKNTVLTGADMLGTVAITVDSPAASVINILPVIYATGKNTYYYNITALFSRADSWMVVKSKDILEHEQIHFDIFELYARKMRRYLVETIQNNYMAGTMNEITDDIAPLFEQLYHQLNELQLEFDRQTAALTATNASLANTNAVWKKGIGQQLAELEQYALPEAIITLN